MMTPSITAIVPAYNRFHLLKKSIESILGQTLPVTEIIVVDDGSFDGTSEKIQDHIASTASWRDCVRYIRQENQGQSTANNNAISQARGDWLAFNADDDLWLPQKLEWQFRALSENGNRCGVCFTDAWFMNNPYMKMTVFQLFGPDYKQDIGVADNVSLLIKHLAQIWMQTIVARADVVRQVGGLDPQLHYQEDQDFLFRLAKATPFCYVGMPMVLIDRTPKAQRHIGQAARWNDEGFRLTMLQARLEKNLSLADSFPPEVHRLLERSLSEVHSGWASWYLQKGDHTKALESATRSLQYHKSPNTVTKWILAKLAPPLAKRVDLARDHFRSKRSFGIGR